MAILQIDQQDTLHPAAQVFSVSAGRVSASRQVRQGVQGGLVGSSANA